MDKIKKHSNNNFTQISNIIINDQNLSYKAKGIFLYLWSKPDNWMVRVNDISNNGKEGRSAIYSALQELEDFNYLKRERYYQDGKIKGINYHLYEEKLNVENLNEENVNEENRSHNNKEDIQIKNIKNIDNNTPFIFSPLLSSEKNSNCSKDCKRKAKFKINNKYLCGQHTRMELERLGKLKLYEDELKENSTIGNNPTVSKIETVNIKSGNTEFNKPANAKNAQVEIYPQELNVEAYREWIKYKKNKYTEQSKKTLIKNLCKYSQEIQEKMIENSIMNTYKGLLFDKYPTINDFKGGRDQKLHQSNTNIPLNNKNAVQGFKSEFNSDDALRLYGQLRISGLSPSEAKIKVKEKLHWNLHKDFDKIVKGKEEQLKVDIAMMLMEKGIY